MAYPSVTYTLSNGTPNDASPVNQNFTDLVNGMSDGTKDMNISALTTAGAVTAGAAVTLGASSSNDLTVNAALASTIAIKTNTTYAIGSATKGLSTLYLGGSSTYTVGVVSATMAASYTLTLPSAVPSATALVSMSSAGVLGVAAATRQTTSPSVDRYQFADPIQPDGSTAPIIQQFSSSTRTLEFADSSTGTARPAVVSAAPATHGLMIVRGSVSSGATITLGEGFTVSSGGTGIYDITFSTAFAEAPVVVTAYNVSGAIGATPLGSDAHVRSVSTSGCTIWTGDSSSLSNAAFYFIAIGQRGA